MFSGDYDKAMAANIIANGAAAYNHDVTIFHTFWGLNELRKEENIPVKKIFMEKMFGKLMPRGSDKVGLSKMNFGGIGPKMIKGIMKKHNAVPLPQLVEMAQEQDIKLIACTMTMDLLGLQNDLIASPLGVKVGKKVNVKILQGILAVLILATAVKIWLDILI